MDWVHCNSCSVQPGDQEKKKFFITNCGHIYCDDCHEESNSGECRICHVQCNVIPLTSNMNSEVEFYFRDPLINLKKQIKVFEFQQSHRIRLITHYRERIRNYKMIKKENFNLNEQLKQCKNENLTLREEIKQIKKEFHECKKKFDQTLSGKSLRMHSFRQFMTKTTPEISPTMVSKKKVQDECIFPLKSSSQRTPNSNFFLMTDSKPISKSSTPDLSKFQSNYRSYKTSTPDMSTPPTPETFFKACSQRELQRKMKLPSGPSPATKIGFQGLSLSRPSSTPKKENVLGNRFPKYFK